MTALTLAVAPVAQAQNEPSSTPSRRSYRVVDSTKTNLTLQDRNGTTSQIAVGSSTVFRLDGRKRTAPQLQPGDMVRVQQGYDAKGRLIALEVDERSSLVLRGKILESDGNQLTIETRRGPLTVGLQPGTQYWIGNLRGPAIALLPGLTVKLQAHPSMSGQLEASTVQANPPWLALGLSLGLSSFVGVALYRRRH